MFGRFQRHLAESRLADILFLEDVVSDPKLVNEQLGAVPVAMEMANWPTITQRFNIIRDSGLMSRRNINLNVLLTGF